jgi:hypothetical protein
MRLFGSRPCGDLDTALRAESVKTVQSIAAVEEESVLDTSISRKRSRGTSNDEIVAVLSHKAGCVVRGVAAAGHESNDHSSANFFLYRHRLLGTHSFEGGRANTTPSSAALRARRGGMIDFHRTDLLQPRQALVARHRRRRQYRSESVHTRQHTRCSLEESVASTMPTSLLVSFDHFSMSAMAASAAALRARSPSLLVVSKKLAPA